MSRQESRRACGQLSARATEGSGSERSDSASPGQFTW